MIQLPPYYNGQWEQIPSPNNPYTATGYRLPTEAEWEFAAQHDDERIYPWGSQMPTCTRANCYSNGLCVGWTSPVGSHPTGTSRLGLQDMAGNVYEWCNDRHASYGSSPQSNPAGPVSGIMRVVRGGSWGENGSEGLQCARRIPSYPSSTDMVFGFRMGQSIP
jgi:formylglycine-generating enzyme required for sulfatase activity